MNRRFMPLPLICLMLLFLLTGCGINKPIEASKISYYTPKKEISKIIANKVAEEKVCKLEIQNLTINNPEMIPIDSSRYFNHSSITLLLVYNGTTYALAANLRNPLQINDCIQQEDILVFLKNISNIHYTKFGENHIEIKNSPARYIKFHGTFYHSYVADIYINKNNNITTFGPNEVYVSKQEPNRKVQTLQIK